MKNKTIAVDLAKNVFEIGVSDRPGHVEKTYRLSRVKFLRFFVNREPATVLMEACGSAHHWGRQIRELGHEVKLISPQYVRPYVPRNKTDRADVKGLLEAYRNSDICPVPIKTMAQQQLTALHRIRSTWMGTRITRINMVRGLLREFGYVIPVGARHLVPGVMGLIEDAEIEIPSVVREMLDQVCGEIRELESHLRSVERELEALAQQTPVVERLRSIPGIGLLTATAMVGFVGDIQRFRSSRQFASYLGLTPRERSSGNQRRLGRISQRGDRYLRTLLIHGGRSLLWTAHKTKNPSPLQKWGLRIHELRGHNKAVVALANKLARRVWAVWKRDCDYQANYRAA
jgi:transposase|tara:strand:+ start:245 stop:1276 length:1032 start_codon:yes stop_codon:yes gene_type:complete